MNKKQTYNLSKLEHINVTNKNLQIRHLIADLLPIISGQDREKYREFFTFTEKLEKRIYYHN